MTTFPATLYKVQVDKEAEARVVLLVPADSLDKILQLTKMTGQLLRVSVDADPSN